MMESSKYIARLLVGLFVLFSLGVAPAQQSDGQRVAAVEIQGLSTYRPSQLLPRLKVQTGKPYSGLDAREDLSYLSRIMARASVSTEAAPSGGVRVVYSVTEFPRLHGIQVVGNKKVKTDRIKALLKLNPGDVLDERAQSSLLKALRAEYRTIGMPQASIVVNVIPLAADPKAERPIPQADFQIVIEEGKQILCKDVIFQGNRAFTTVRLRLQINTKGSWSFIKNYYGEDAFRDDLATLRDFYAAHGYFDARIDRGPFQIEDKGELQVVSPVIQIGEGVRYTFGHAVVRGARLFSKDDVNEPFKPLEGQLFDGKKFLAAIDQLRALYQDHGLLTTEINPKYEYDVKRKILNMTIEVSEKNRIYVGKIKLVRPVYNDDEKGWFRGWYNRFSPPVKEETVTREVLLKPGEIYNKRLERESMRKLSQLGVFDNDKLRAYNEPTGEPGVHNMVIEAVEANTGAISGGVGYGDISGAFIFANFAERNIGGEANTFSIQGMLGTKTSSITGSYLVRHLNGGDNSLLTRLYFTNQIAPGYLVRTVGGSSEFGHPLDPEWTLFLRPRVEWVNLSPDDNFIHYKDIHEDVDQSYGVVTGRARVVQDTRYPYEGHYREGYLQGMSVEAGYAGGALARLEASRDQYLALSPSLTYRMDAFGGIMPYSASTLPIQERYFLGGDTDMRGFKYRGAGYFDSGNHDVPIGGAAKLLVKNEMLYPIYDPVSGVAFVDTGMLGESPVSYQAPRVSTGLGLRFDLKNVQVALDFAVPVLKQDSDETRFFHFSLHSQF